MNHGVALVSSIVYGPVASWRLGRSLGVDLISTDGKTCSFDCVYCQLGPTVHALSERREFVSLRQLSRELEAVKDIRADCVTFSGLGEPTLASNLGQAISLVSSTFDLPVAVLTNSSLMLREDVRRDLLQADEVVAKVDAPDDAVLRAVNRPSGGCSHGDIVQGLRMFRKDYRGKLAIQMMFVQANRHCAGEMAEIARGLSPDEVQLNTPLRPCGVEPLSPAEMAAVKEEFRGSNLVEVYETQPAAVAPVSVVETLRRRPVPPGA